MKSGQVIPYTDTCNYLGNTICSHDENVIIDNDITDMYIRLNNLLAEFSHCDIGTLSTLFGTYCMNIFYMGVKRGDIIATIWMNFILHGERQFAEFEIIPYRTHNKLVYLINKSCSINIRKKEY